MTSPLTTFKRIANSPSVLLVTLALMAGVAVTATAGQHPNVIIVMTDDQGFPNVGFNGHPVLQTPNLDAFAHAGVRLADFHVDPTCAPTRSALMTGRYSGRVGVWHTVMGRSFLRQRETTMADIFARAGYATGVFGKWHLGDAYPFRPVDRGFQRAVTHGGGGVGQTPDFWGNDYFDDVYRVDGVMKQFRGFCTDVFFREAMIFMKQAVEAGQPFFAYIAPNAPHGPFYSPDADSAEVSERLDRGRFKAGKTEELVNYYGMIENIDENFGRLRSFLESSGLEDNTVLIFLSDNGPVLEEGREVFNAGLRGMKTSHYDGGHVVPWAMRWPGGGLNKGVEIPHVTAHIDMLPTLIELTGLTAPKIDFDGSSLVPLFRNPDADWPGRRLVVENQRVVDPIKYRNSAVMSDDWRMIGNGQKVFELYRTRSDRGQTRDVAADHPKTVAEMKSVYESFWADVSTDHKIVSRMIVGSSHQNPVSLTAHDWLGNTLWNQHHIRHPEESDFGSALGHWEVLVETDGWYQISLRRWPAEADKTICDPYVGTGYDIRTARVEIQGQKVGKPVRPEDKEVTFRVKLKSGKARLETLFFGDHDKISAFYAYILREDGTPDADWQTREGLGLPPAIWPEKHGADTSKTTFQKSE